jgi:hypothetical protein
VELLVLQRQHTQPKIEETEHDRERAQSIVAILVKRHQTIADLIVFDVVKSFLCEVTDLPDLFTKRRLANAIKVR